MLAAIDSTLYGSYVADPTAVTENDPAPPANIQSAWLHALAEKIETEVAGLPDDEAERTRQSYYAHASMVSDSWTRMRRLNPSLGRHFAQSQLAMQPAHLRASVRFAQKMMTRILLRQLGNDAIIRSMIRWCWEDPMFALLWWASLTMDNIYSQSALDQAKLMALRDIERQQTETRQSGGHHFLSNLDNETKLLEPGPLGLPDQDSASFANEIAQRWNLVGPWLQSANNGIQALGSLNTTIVHNFK
jgi:hypothetical protein